MDAVAIATLIVASIGTAVALSDWMDRRRYVEFLRRVHIEAAEAVQRIRDEHNVVTSTAVVKVEPGELDLAFRALAEDIMRVRSDGAWEARAVRLRAG